MDTSGPAVGTEERLSEIKDPRYPTRLSPIEPLPKDRVLTNHFEYSITAVDVYEYRILDINSKDKRKTKAIYQHAVDTWPTLANNQSSFVTNDFDAIVSWEAIHKDIEKPLLTGDGDTSGTWELTLKVNDELKEYRFELVAKHDVASLQQYSNGNPAFEKHNFNAIAKCLNMIISKTFDVTKLYRQSANKFFVKEARRQLYMTGPPGPSRSLELVRGYYYTIKPGTGNIVINFNLATIALYTPILVSAYFADRDTFGDKQFENLENLSVYVVTERKKAEHQHQDLDKMNSFKNRTKKVKGRSDKVIGELTFPNRRRNADGTFVVGPDGRFVKDGTATKVLGHLQNTFGRSFNPSSKAINCGTKDDPIWYAEEQLQILPWQIYRRPVPDKLTASMVQQAAKDPDSVRALIETEGLASLGFNDVAVKLARKDSIDQRHDVPVELVPSMMQVPYRALSNPMPRYKDGNQALAGVSIGSDREARWSMPYRHRFFLTNPQDFKYVIFRLLKDERPNAPFNPYAPRESTVAQYGTAFHDQLVRCGLDPRAIARPQIWDLAGFSHVQLDPSLKAAKSQGMNLVVLILGTQNVDIYSTFKSIAERNYGLQTVCLVEKLNKSNLQEYMTNVMMKVNLKLRGFSHSVKSAHEYLEQEDAVVLGADVVHPGPTAFGGCPSIAAIVGSVDYSVGRCLGSMRLQKIEKEERDENGKIKFTAITDREVIQTVEDMVIERLNDWKLRGLTKRLPSSIIYYRDGVSETQYSTVKAVEIAAIRTAYAKASGSAHATVNITAVVVTKRHNTRFFPMSARPPPRNSGTFTHQPPDRDMLGNQNCKPGTFISDLVTSPYYQDFFLQSHSAIKGTARPTQYFVLEDGILGLTLERLRDLTHGICYSYARGTVGVSYASPTYYADRLCERGRLYMRGFFVKDKDTTGTMAALDEYKGVLKSQFARDLERALPRDKVFTKDPEVERKQHAEKRRAREKEFKEEVGVLLRRFVYERVEREFYNWRGDADGRMNPWGRELDGTMFWM